MGKNQTRRRRRTDCPRVRPSESNSENEMRTYQNLDEAGREEEIEPSQVEEVNRRGGVSAALDLNRFCNPTGAEFHMVVKEKHISGGRCQVLSLAWA